MSDTLSIEGFGPIPVRRPTSDQEVRTLVREAAASGQAVYPVGGRTRLDLGWPPSRAGFAIEMTGLAGVIDYPARDMTITVQAGITRARLSAILAAEGQYLPVDLPAGERGTLGGALAANLNGPRRLARGTLRDYVIGISFVADDGTEVRGGGRVVKNVAGYDLMKLQIGALGTLGVITQATLKVFPKPEGQAFVGFGVNTAALGPTLDRLHSSASRPVAVEVLNTTAAKAIAAAAAITLPESEPWVVLAGFEEKAVTVSWQTTTLHEELKSAPARDLTTIPARACEPLWRVLTDFQDAESRFSVKLGVVPSRVGGLLANLAATSPDLRIQAHAGNGIVHLHFPANFPLEQAATALTELKRRVEPNGFVQVRRCPVEWKDSLPFWSPNRGDLAVMQTIKTTLDPSNVFNPGRLLRSNDK